jgi:hypothetical protein
MSLSLSQSNKLCLNLQRAVAMTAQRTPPPSGGYHGLRLWQ